MSDTMIRYTVGFAEKPTVTGVCDLVDSHVRKAARFTETDEEETREQLNALRVLVGRLLSKAALRGIVSADELIEWLDVPDAHEASLASPTAEAVAELRRRTGAGILDCKAALRQCDEDIDKAAVLLARLGTRHHL